MGNFKEILLDVITCIVISATRIVNYSDYFNFARTFKLQAFFLSYTRKGREERGRVGEREEGKSFTVCLLSVIPHRCSYLSLGLMPPAK